MTTVTTVLKFTINDRRILSKPLTGIRSSEFLKGVCVCVLPESVHFVRAMQVSKCNLKRKYHLQVLWTKVLSPTSNIVINL